MMAAEHTGAGPSGSTLGQVLRPDRDTALSSDDLIWLSPPVWLPDQWQEWFKHVDRKPEGMDRNDFLVISYQHALRSFVDVVRDIGSQAVAGGPITTVDKQWELMQEAPHAEDVASMMLHILALSPNAMKKMKVKDQYGPFGVFSGALFHDIIGKVFSPYGWMTYRVGSRPDQQALDAHVSGAMTLLADWEHAHGVRFPREVMLMVKNSHEKQGRRGYPWQKERVPVLARWLQVVDNWVAPTDVSRLYLGGYRDITASWEFLKAHMTENNLDGAIVADLEPLVEEISRTWKPTSLSEIVWLFNVDDNRDNHTQMRRHMEIDPAVGISEYDMAKLMNQYIVKRLDPGTDRLRFAIRVLTGLMLQLPQDAHIDPDRFLTIWDSAVELASRFDMNAEYLRLFEEAKGPLEYILGLHNAFAG